MCNYRGTEPHPSQKQAIRAGRAFVTVEGSNGTPLKVEVEAGKYAPTISRPGPVAWPGTDKYESLTSRLRDREVSQPCNSTPWITALLFGMVITILALGYGLAWTLQHATIVP